VLYGVKHALDLRCRFTDPVHLPPQKSLSS
jgi:hypothetical protein